MFCHSHVFGPIKSRRLGNSLGINILPNGGKVCSFDCVYCEAGANADGREDQELVTREALREELECFLQQYVQQAGAPIDTITFAGNGEPTVHPEFEAIIDDTLLLRNRYQPRAVVSVLTNAWQLSNESVCRALRKVDNCILKLDSAVPATLLKMNRPVRSQFAMDQLIAQLADFGHDAIIQTMFLRGPGIDNTTPDEVKAWIAALRQIGPRQVQLYPLDRPAPVAGLEKVPVEELRAIAAQVEQYGIETLVIG